MFSHTCQIRGVTPPTLVIGCLLLFFALKANAEIVLNEILSQNTIEGYLAEDGNAYDWIELHNTGADEVDLLGTYLTDDENDLTKWSFTRSFTIPAGGFAVVFASDLNDLIEGQEHLNFKLDAGDGEYLALIANDGVTILDEFSPQFPSIRENLTYGIPSGGGEATFLITATPNAANSEGGPIPVIHSFTTTKEVIANGESVTITWETENGTSVTLNTTDANILRVDASGSTILHPTRHQTVTLRTWNLYGEAKQVINILVPPVVNSFTASPSTIATGGQSILRWETEGSGQVIEVDGHPVTHTPSPSVFIPMNLNFVVATDSWKKAPEQLVADWREIGFDDAEWIETSPPFDEKGLFRTSFEVTDPDSLTAGVLRHHTNGSSFEATLNGITIFKTGNSWGVPPELKGDIRINPAFFVEGTNVLAIRTYYDALSYQFSFGAWRSQASDTIVPVTLKTTNGGGVSSKTVEFTVLAEGTPLPPLPTIAISEFFWSYYGAANVEPYRFFEIENCGTETLDLNGIQLTGSSIFNFADSTDPLLESGRHAVVVHHLPTFSEVWPGERSVVGQIENPHTSLHHDLSVALLDPYGRIFERIPLATLPTSPNLSQPLERIDPKQASDNPENWFTSEDYLGNLGYGSPGKPSLRIVDFSFDPPFASPGDPVTLNWEVSRDSTVFISDGIGEVHSTSGSINLTVPKDSRSYQFWIDAIGTYARVRSLASLTLPPALSYFGANKTAVLPGEEIQLSRDYLIPNSNYSESYSSELQPPQRQITTFTPLQSGFPRGRTWRYIFDPDSLGPDWLNPDYAMPWGGSAPLGFGYELIDRELPAAQGVTSYFQKSFYVGEVDEIDSLSVELMVDDGAVVYLNGQEIIRENLPAGAIDHLTPALVSIDEPIFNTYVIDPSLLIEGDNSINAEVHNFNLEDEDLVFDLAVNAQRPVPANGRKNYSVTATNEAGTTEATLTILFTEPIPVESWQTENGLLGDPETTDSDGDGLNDLLEFATGTDPHHKSPHPISFVIDDEGHYIVSYPRDLRTDDAPLTLQVSDDLNLWTNAANPLSGMVFQSALAPDDSPVATVIFRSYAPARLGKKFVRLIATP